MITGILCAHGTFVSAEGGGDGDVNANRAALKQWETFSLCNIAGIPFGENATIANNTIVTLRTMNGQLLFPKWGGKILADALTPIGAGFNLVVLSGTVSAGQRPVVAFRSPGKQPTPGSLATEFCWVTAEINDPRPLVANRQMPTPKAWELFTLQISLGIQIV